MKTTWLIENYSDGDDYRDLIASVIDSGRGCHVIDKHNYFDFNPEKYKEIKPLLFQGTIQLGKKVKKELPNATLFCSEEKFLCSRYYPFFQKYLFNDRHISTTVKDLKERKFEFYAKFGKEALIWVRPDSGDKTFSGQLIDLQDFDRFWSNKIVCNVEDSDIVYISTPKTVVGEYRFVVSENKIIANSTYLFQKQSVLIPSVPKKATDLVNELLKVDYKPDLVYCFDICSDGDDNFWLLEITSFSVAGLYMCDKKKIAEEVSRIVEETHENSQI